MAVAVRGSAALMLSGSRPLAKGRRLQAFLTTGKYRDELADARWVA